MAMTYQNFASLGVNLNRQKNGPLDISNVFTSAADLKYYLSEGTFTEGVSKYWYESATKKVVPYPYEGQVLATVIDGEVKVYVLRLDEDGAFEAKAIEPEVDNTTIKLTNGKLELVGLPTDTAGKTYVPSYINGELTWAEPDTETIEGQGAAIAALETRATTLESDIYGKAAVGEEGTEGYQPAIIGLVDQLAAEATARAVADSAIETKIAEALAEAKQYADDNDNDTVYDDSDLTARVVATEQSIDDHAGRIAGIELFFKDAAKDEGEGENLKNALDTLVEIQEFINTEGTTADAIVKDIASNKAAIEKLNGADTVEGSVAKTVKDAVADQAVITDAAIAEVRTTAENAAVKTVVESALALKADKTQLADYYLKTETYDTETIDNKIAALAGENLVSGLTLSKLSSDLDDHISTSADAFTEIENKQTEQDTAIGNNATAIALINHETDGILAKAKADAQLKIDNLVSNGQVATNTAAIAKNASDISTINGNINGINSNITSLGEEIGTLKAKDNSLESAISTETAAREALGKTVGEHTTSINALTDKDAELDAAIKANTTKFDNYSTTTEVESKIATAIGNIDYTSINDEIAANTKAISDEKTRAEAKESELAGLINENATDIATNASDIKALETTINAVIENEDSTALNSIKELAAWISEHDTDVLPIVNSNKAAIELLNDKNGKEGSIQKTVSDAIAKIPSTPIATSTTAGIVKASDEITVSADGDLGVGYISTDKLLQGSEILILNGGSATVATV